MRPPRSLRRVAMVVALLTATIGAATPARSRTVLEDYVAERAAVERTISRLRDDRARTVLELRRVVAGSTNRLQRLSGRGSMTNPERFAHLRRTLLHERRRAMHRIERSGRVVARRVGALQARRRSIDCVARDLGHLPRTARSGAGTRSPTTSASPCDCRTCRCTGTRATTSSPTPARRSWRRSTGMPRRRSSELGGLEVRVTGSRGYVYNAHLSSYGTLGYVRAGTVIGYVGATGDATTSPTTIWSGTPTAAAPSTRIPTSASAAADGG